MENNDEKKYTMEELKVLYTKGEIKDDNWCTLYDEDGKPHRWFPGSYIKECIEMDKEAEKRLREMMFSTPMPDTSEMLPEYWDKKNEDEERG